VDETDVADLASQAIRPEEYGNATQPVVAVAGARISASDAYFTHLP
jgi:hypothetical protein